MLDTTALSKSIETLATETEANAVSPEYIANLLRKVAALLHTAKSDTEANTQYNNLSARINAANANTEKVRNELNAGINNAVTTADKQHQLITGRIDMNADQIDYLNEMVGDIPTAQTSHTGSTAQFIHSSGIFDQNLPRSRSCVLTLGQTRIFQEGTALRFRRGFWSANGTDKYITATVPLASLTAAGVMPHTHFTAIAKLSSAAIGEYGTQGTADVTIALPVTTTPGGSSLRTFKLNAATSARAGLMTATDKTKLNAYADTFSGNASVTPQKKGLMSPAMLAKIDPIFRLANNFPAWDEPVTGDKYRVTLKTLFDNTMPNTLDYSYTELSFGVNNVRCHAKCYKVGMGKGYLEVIEGPVTASGTADTPIFLNENTGAYGRIVRYRNAAGVWSKWTKTEQG